MFERFKHPYQHIKWTGVVCVCVSMLLTPSGLSELKWSDNLCESVRMTLTPTGLSELTFGI